ncbi:MAG TPA: type IV toxin-antitoxin system AbiEi family antitoxin domain-containing protein [Solirubrobacterales bacterium]|nr:type IV toxin-antitoxin system AbiEi family antitoxin domain-containing protein [Solirubrobacterales bacterium]
MSRERERAIAKLAGRQRGLVTRGQLLDLGLTRAAIDHRLKSARLHPLHRGVYRLGHARMLEGAPELGAVLACGRNAVASHRSAGWLWRLLPRPPEEVEVTVIARDCRSRPGLRVHTLAALDRRDVRRLGDIPVTAAARTILDLAAVVPSRALELAIAEAEARRLVRRTDLLAVLARYPRRPGGAGLRALIQADVGPALTRSEAEERFLALVRSADLPTPEVNARLGRHEVDFLWRDERLVVEIDGFAFHGSRRAFERDRLRDAGHVAAGYRVIRITWRQLVASPEAVVARVAAALAADRR